jgi:predicted esterase
MRTELVHLFVPAADDTAPSLLALHGTGGAERDLLSLARTINPEGAILSPRGAVLENGKPRFFRRIAEGVFDLEDLARRTKELAEFIDEAAGEYGFDPARLYALGYSNGANIAASLLLTDPRILAGGILLRAMVPFEPVAVPNLDGRAVLLSSGRDDPLVRPQSVERLDALLKAGGADVTLNWVNAGHSLVPADIEVAAQWFSTR